ncbi:MAG: hypothetical protein NW241_18475 [Bacteroidia bacterium]|nr:hypothetical protein [Bacteroidia bacterium]
MRGFSTIACGLFLIMGSLVCIASLSAQTEQADKPTQSAQSTREYQSGYRFFQNTAPEFLQIEISEVATDADLGKRNGNGIRVRATARVIDVIRSDSGVVQGGTVVIAYVLSARAGNAAETPPLLEKGKTYPAFLEKKGGVFVPAARHLSFSPPSGIQMKVYEEARTRSREKALAQASRPAKAGPEPRVTTTGPLVAPLMEDNANPQPTPVVRLSKPLVETTPDDQPLPTASPDPTTPTALSESSPANPGDKPIVVPLNPLPRSQPQPEVRPEAEPNPLTVETQRPAPVRITQPTATVPANAPAPALAPQEAGESLPTVTADEPPAKVVALPPPPKPTDRSSEIVTRQNYADIYGIIKEADVLKIQGENDKARELYQAAKEKLLKLKEDQPEFQPFIVAYRLKDLDKKLAATQAK